MYDENRLNRIHVETVRFKNKKFFIILVDKNGIEIEEVEWDYWISLPEDQRRNY